jgi:hypothetical protein
VSAPVAAANGGSDPSPQAPPSPAASVLSGAAADAAAQPAAPGADPAPAPVPAAGGGEPTDTPPETAPPPAPAAEPAVAPSEEPPATGGGAAELADAAAALLDVVVPVDVGAIGAAVEHVFARLQAVSGEVGDALTETESVVVLLGVAVALTAYDARRRRRADRPPPAFPTALTAEPCHD